MEVGEIQSEAWLVAQEQERKRGYPIDFANPGDQETLIGILYNRFVNFAEKHFRYAVKLDQGSDDDESQSIGEVLANILQAPAAFSPEARLEVLQDVDEIAQAMRRSYSEATAYAILLQRFDWKAKLLAEYLLVALATLRARLARAGRIVRHQPSLFDGVEAIPDSFAAAQDGPRRRVLGVHLAGMQWSWDFEADGEYGTGVVGAAQ